MLKIWANLSNMKILYAIGAGLLVIVVIIGGRLFMNYQDSSLLQIKNSEIDLTQFLPFDESTKVVKLSSDSRLKLTEDLPIMDGATALYPVYSAFARAVYPKAYYGVTSGEVMCNKTSGAFDNLLASKADIIFIASPSSKQLDTAKSQNITLDLHKIGSEAFVFFVNSNNPIDSLTREQIRGIYSGKYTNWRQLGGSNQSIKAFQRPEGSGSQSALIKFMDGQKLVDPLMDEVESGMGGIVTSVADYKNSTGAIGFSFRYYLQDLVANKDIKMLRVDGVEPTIAHIKDLSYPLVTEFFAITRSNPTANTTLLLNWIFTDQGKEIIEKTGYVGIDL
jgi:phosphate transport system substrate-binding protein